VRQEQRPDERELGPESGHLGVEQRHVVEDLDAVDAAVVDLVLDGLEEVVVTDGVLGFSQGLGEEPVTSSTRGLTSLRKGGVSGWRRCQAARCSSQSDILAPSV